MNGILLDTCAIIWIANGEALKNDATSLIQEAQNNCICYISPISAWEIAHLVAKKKITLSMPIQEWFEHILNIDGIIKVDLSPKILMSSVELDWKTNSDPADRIMVATARSLNLSIVSRDGLIKKYAQEGMVKFIEC